MKKAIYAGSFDPITKGHENVINRILKDGICDELIVATGVNPEKASKYTFSLEERQAMTQKALEKFPNVKVVSFEGSLPDYAFKHGIPVVIRGYRNGKDAEQELDLFNAYNSQDLGAGGIEMFLLPAKQEMTHFSSSNAKGILTAPGDIHEMVQLHVKQAMEARLLGQYKVNLTGGIACGKSYVTDKLQKIGEKQGIPVYNIDLDDIGHQILKAGSTYQRERDMIVREFGQSVKDVDGSISRKKLAPLVFGNQEKLEKLNEIMHPAIVVEHRSQMRGKKGLMLINGALIVEAGLSYLASNNTVLVTADEASQYRRLKERGHSDAEIKKRIASQFNTAAKMDALEKTIAQYNYGDIFELDNSDGRPDSQIELFFNQLVQKMDQFGELRFRGLWDRIGADGTPDDEYRRIVQAYSSGKRYYHTLKHVVDTLGDFEQAKEFMQNPDAVLFAWFYHDIVKRDKSNVDEKRSAELVYSVCKNAELSENFASTTKGLVYDTRHHEIPETLDGKFIADLDLLIFARPPPVFNQYDLDIRQEYWFYPDEVYIPGRKQVLEGFLAKEHIFQTDFFREKYEDIARENLKIAISNL